ncbi:SMC5-SMC6 complex localization factor protein 1 isoform X1 [Coregonus clupeaformis]|uniref:SMC5-SMC6 complex localization factor protein 1 isoform X1 n=2 Tax=Coregonus clupeaformis TaxID=59861 RepID=UPI001E1C6937|nr:SMC5-SMC6 complex localization factor protein 1 isoform X1 [Coregonus clupeaformis]
MHEPRMVDTKHVFQVSGIKNLKKKGKLLHGILQLGGKYIGGSVYKDGTTHLIVTHELLSEKFIAACAGGKWIVTPEYIFDSVKNGLWLPEGPYELDIVSMGGVPGASNPVKVWRERVTSGAMAGAFEGWRVLLMVNEPTHRDMLRRILKAGKANVYSYPPPSHADVTHVLTKHIVDRVKAHNAPCYSIEHMALHLFGQNVCSDMGLTWTVGQPEETQEANDALSTDFSELESEARDYISQIEERKRLPDILSYYAPGPYAQTAGANFSNVQSLTECGLFTQALEELQLYLLPGQLPPAPFLQPLMHHALHGDAKPFFLSEFRTVLYSILRNNPPWGSPASGTFFMKVLQCPQCQKGVWPLLETSLRFCMGSKPCHSLPSPASPELLRFHGDLQAFMLELFKCDMHSANKGEVGDLRSSVLYRVFWSLWERSTLGSRAVQQLAQLLVQASQWERSVSEGQERDWERDRRQTLVLTLQDTLGVVVDFWWQEHSHLNRSLVDKCLEDLAQHIAILCQDLPPDVLQTFVPGMVPTRLRMVTADAIFRNVCCRNGITIGAEPLSLRKIVSSYLPALRRLCAVRTGGSRDLRADSGGPQPGTEPTSCSWSTQGTATGMASSLVNGAGLGKENIPRGLNRVNTAGETLLHRACKKNQVETLLQILALPGTDVNVKDHAGWTPLHEACNHGSIACVEALLRHQPAPHLYSQVGGVSPLHDALLGGHTDIAMMLLQHAGSDLLQQRDCRGRTALDLVSTATLREELQRSALAGDVALEALGSEVRDLPFLETCSCLLTCLLLTYQLERAVPFPPPFFSSSQAQDRPLSLWVKLARALESHSARRLTAGWGDPRLVRLAEDMETALGVEECLTQLCPAIRECQGPHTRLLITLLEEMKAHRAALLSHTL